MAIATPTSWTPPLLDLSVDRYAAFKSWKARWNDYKVVTKLDEQSVEYQCSMLRYTFSEETRKIYDTLGLTEEEQKDPKVIIEKLENFAKGTVNVTMERHTFNTRNQEEGELFDDFLTEIKILSKNCVFCAQCHDGLIRDRIVAGIRDSQLRQKLLADDKLDLKKAEDSCRAKEKAMQGAKLFKQSKESSVEGEINEVSHSMRNQRFGNRSFNNSSGRRGGKQRMPPTNKPTGASWAPQQQQQQQPGAIRKQPPCKFCTQRHQRGRQYCPAWGNTCVSCGKPNHASGSILCSKTHGVRCVENEDAENEDEDLGYLYIGAVEVSSEAEDNENSYNVVEGKDAQVGGFETFSRDDTEDDLESGYEAEDEYSDDETGEKETEVEEIPETSENHEIDQPEIINTVEADLEREVVNEEAVREIRKKQKRKQKKRKYKIKQKTKKAINETEGDNMQEPLSWEVHMPAANGTIQFKLDTGADVTVMPPTDLQKLGMKETDIRHTHKKLYGANGQRIQCLGFVSVEFTWGDKTEKQIIYVCKNIRRALLGKPTINKFKMIQMNIPQNFSCGNVDVVDEDQEQLEEKTAEEEFTIMAEKYPFLKDYKDVFTKLGKITAGDEVNIRVREGTQPHQTYSPRHIPLPLLGKVIDEVKRMQDMGVIRKIDKPTKWCHPIVIVVKPSGDIRLCIDLTKLNAGVERELYQLESVDETMGKLGDECVFMSKLDANCGYWQVPLDEESQELTTFITPVGRFCCTRGPYGLSSMQEIFSKKMDIVIEGLQGIVKSTDDFLVYARTKRQLQERTESLLKRFQKYGVTVNAKKCIFERQEMDFLGHSITKEGIKPLRSKMEAIKKFPPPTNITEFMRIMGMANQMAKFNPNLAEALAPLRDLLSSRNSWL